MRIKNYLSSADLAKNTAARLDLDNIFYIVEVEHLTPVVALHAQQAIEKSLKALLEFNNIKNSENS